MPFIIITVEQAWLDFSHLSPAVCACVWEGFRDTSSSPQPKPIPWHWLCRWLWSVQRVQTLGCHGCHTLIWLGRAGRMSRWALSNDDKVAPTNTFRPGVLLLWKNCMHCFCFAALLFYGNITCHPQIYSLYKNLKHLNSIAPSINWI